MGITVAANEQYINSVKKLLPQGEYWDRQLADPQSGISLFIKAKIDELVRFRLRVSALFCESRIETTDELIAGWERVMLGEQRDDMPLKERRQFLLSREIKRMALSDMRKIAEAHRLNIISIDFIRPAFFGHSRFGVDLVAGPAAFSVLFVKSIIDEQIIKPVFMAHFKSSCFGFARCGIDRIIHPFSRAASRLYAALAGMSFLQSFEEQIQTQLLAHQIIYFSYGVYHAKNVS